MDLVLRQKLSRGVQEILNFSGVDTNDLAISKAVPSKLAGQVFLDPGIPVWMFLPLDELKSALLQKVQAVLTRPLYFIFHLSKFLDTATHFVQKKLFSGLKDSKNGNSRKFMLCYLIQMSKQFNRPLADNSQIYVNCKFK